MVRSKNNDKIVMFGILVFALILGKIKYLDLLIYAVAPIISLKIIEKKTKKKFENKKKIIGVLYGIFIYIYLIGINSIFLIILGVTGYILEKIMRKRNKKLEKKQIYILISISLITNTILQTIIK